jgi:hypothetical protein
MENISMVCGVEKAEESDSACEMVLVHSMTEISTSDLQEYGSSLDDAKRNKKKKRKKGGQKMDNRDHVDSNQEKGTKESTVVVLGRF